LFARLNFTLQPWPSGHGHTSSCSSTYQCPPSPHACLRAISQAEHTSSFITPTSVRCTPIPTHTCLRLAIICRHPSITPHPPPRAARSYLLSNQHNNSQQHQPQQHPDSFAQDSSPSWWLSLEWLGCCLWAVCQVVLYSWGVIDEESPASTQANAAAVSSAQWGSAVEGEARRGGVFGMSSREPCTSSVADSVGNSGAASSRSTGQEVATVIEQGSLGGAWFGTHRVAGPVMWGVGAVIVGVILKVWRLPAAGMVEGVSDSSSSSSRSSSSGRSERLMGGEGSVPALQAWEEVVLLLVSCASFHLAHALGGASFFSVRKVRKGRCVTSCHLTDGNALFSVQSLSWE
jgi:hypothetical protein